MLRVVRLNVDSLVSAGWRERRDEIVNGLDELDVDVVGLREIWLDDRHPNTGGAEHAAGPAHLTMRPAALPPGMPFELVHVRTAGLDVESTHL